MTASRYPIKSGTLMDDYGSLTGWSLGSNGTLELNTNPAYLTNGTASLKMTTAGTGASSSFAITKTVSYDLSKAGTFKWRFYMDDDATLQKVSSMRLRLSSTADFSKYFEYTYSTTRRAGWNEVLIQKDEFVNTGGEDWANLMITERIQLGAKTSNTVATVYVDSLYTNVYDRPKCILFFDDISDTHYTVAYGMMKKYKFRGTLAMVSKYPDTSGKMTQAQLDEMHNAGWDIVNHSVNHVAMATTYGTDIDSIKGDITGCRDYMLRNGYTRNDEHRMFVFPLSNYNETCLTALSDLGFITGRNKYERTQPNVVESSYLMCGQSNDSGTTAAAIKSKIDSAISEGGTCILYFHIFRTPEDIATTLDPAIFQEVVDYLAAKANQIDVIPFTEWYHGVANGSIRKRADVW